MGLRRCGRSCLTRSFPTLFHALLHSSFARCFQRRAFFLPVGLPALFSCSSCLTVLHFFSGCLVCSLVLSFFGRYTIPVWWLFDGPPARRGVGNPAGDAERESPAARFQCRALLRRRAVVKPGRLHVNVFSRSLSGGWGEPLRQLPPMGAVCRVPTLADCFFSFGVLACLIISSYVQSP